MKPRPDGDAGFTLIEVLVAFVILTLVVTMCLQVYTRSAETEARARWSERGHELLRDRLASFESNSLQPGQTLQGQTGDGLRWSIAAATPLSSSPGLQRGIVWITAQVTDPSGGRYTASTARWLGEMTVLIPE